MALKTSLVSYWKFDESSGDAIDAHGDNDITVYGATQGVTGILNNAVDLDGSNDFLDASDVIADVSSSTTGTIGLWVKRGTATGNRGLIGFGDNSSTAYSSFFIDDGVVTLDWNTNVSSRDKCTCTTTTITAGNDYFIVLTSDGSTNKIYINGTLQTLSYSYGSNNGLWFGDLDATWDNLTIGNLERNSGVSSTFFFDGIIDEAFISNQEFTSTQISEVFDGGDCLSYDDWDGSTPTVDDNALFMGCNF